MYYKGFHQTDVIRIKSCVHWPSSRKYWALTLNRLDRLNKLTEQEKPFFLAITPFAPHVGQKEKSPTHRPLPPRRHNQRFPDLKIPRNPNFNPEDEHQTNRGGWVKNLPKMDNEAVDFADFVFRTRAQALYAVDEIVEDVVKLLEDKGVIDNTYSKGEPGDPSRSGTRNVLKTM